MRHASSRPDRLCAALLAALAAGCLPEAGPPEGTRLVAERHVAGVSFLTGGSGAEPRLLFGRRTGFRELYPGGDVVPVLDLWTVPPQGAPARLLEGTDWQQGPITDALGRLWAVRGRRYDVTGGQNGELVRIDTAGALVSVGRVTDAFGVSPGRTRLFYRPGGQTQAVVRELDDRETTVNADSYLGRFVGESFVFQVDRELWALPPGQQQPARLVEDVDQWQENRASSDLQLAVVTGGHDPTPPVDSGDMMMMPVRTLQLVQASGARVLWQGQLVSHPVFAPADDRIAIIERVSGTGALRLQVFHTGGGDHSTFELGATAPDGPAVFFFSQVIFRPGTAEIWCSVPSGLRVVRADGSVLSVDGPSLQVSPFRAPLDSPDFIPGQEFATLGDSAVFSADGRHWLYTERNYAIYVGQADDPAAPGVLLEDRGDAPVATVREVPGGRRVLLTAAPPGQAKHWNLTAVDLETDQRRLLATSVGASLVGSRRVLVMANETGGLYDLRLVDIDTGEDHLLAQNVTTFAAAPACPTCDPTGAGVAVAYAVHARVPFKYDGLWRAELP